MAAPRESRAPRAIWGPPAFQDFKVRKVFPACRESKATREIKASLDLKVFLDPLDPLDRMTSSKANRGSLALKVPLG